MDHKKPAETLDQDAQAIGMSVTCDFVPLSKSRNAGEKHLTINWRVSLYLPAFGVLGAPDVLVWRGDYSQGIAHLRGYNKACTPQYWQSIQGDARLRAIAETGRDEKTVPSPVDSPLSVVEPTLVDVLSSLLQDASALNEGSFEEWARNLGYDPDSRSAEAIWRACVEVGLKLRRVLGDKAMARMLELAQQI